MSFFLLVLTAATVSFLFAPLASRLSYAVGALDVPDGGRHRHARLTPRGGGLAFFSATLVAAAVYGIFFSPDGGAVSAFLLGGAAVFSIGYFDDARALSPRLKLMLETGVFCLLLPACGLLLPPSSLLSLSLTVGFLLLSVNALNVVDGADGVAASSAMAAFFGFLFLANECGGRDAFTLSAIILFALVGFFPYNAPSARLFMGDGGSLFLGFAEGMCALLLLRGGISPVRILFCMALPLLDLTLAFLRRVRHRRPLFTGDRAHIHHRLADRGLSPHAVLAVTLSVSLLFTLTGVFLIR